MRSSLRYHLDSPRISLLIAAVFYFIFMLLQFQKNGYDISYFVQAGDFFVNPDQAPPNLTILHKSYGYDGQFYYRLALDPFSNERTAFGVTLDSPHYRQQRIIYPIIVWLFSFGQPSLVPIALVLVNCVGLCIMGLIGGIYAQSIQRHALWGIVFPLYPGFLFAVTRDLTEIVELCFVFAAYTYVNLKPKRCSTILLAFAVFAKEPAILANIAILIPSKLRKISHVFKFCLDLLPISLYIIWQIWLYYQWKDLLISDLHNNIGYPLMGYIGLFKDVALLSNHSQLVGFLELCFIMIFTISVIYACFITVDRRNEKISWVFYLILVYLLTRSVWVEDMAFLRACSEFYLFGVMILLASRSKWGNIILSANIACCLLLMADITLMR